MATYNVTGPGGTTGHPSNVRRPYLIENTIDISAINGDTGAADGDVLQAIDIPAESLCLAAGNEVLTAGSSSVTYDIGFGGDPDRWVDGDTNAVGYGDLRTVTDNATTALPFGNAVVFGSADTIDVTIGGAADSAGKIRVWAVLVDISGVEESDLNTDSQHDTTV